MNIMDIDQATSFKHKRFCVVASENGISINSLSKDGETYFRIRMTKREAEELIKKITDELTYVR